METQMYAEMKECQLAAIKLCQEVYKETGFKYDAISTSSLGVSLFIQAQMAKKKPSGWNK